MNFLLSASGDYCLVQEEAVVSRIYHKMTFSNSISQHQGALEGGREDAKSAARSKAIYAARAGG